jgi:hypothetical protein
MTTQLGPTVEDNQNPVILPWEIGYPWDFVLLGNESGWPEKPKNDFTLIFSRGFRLAKIFDHLRKYLLIAKPPYTSPMHALYFPTGNCVPFVF